MFKIFNDTYYVDIDEIEKYINIPSSSGGSEMHINVVKYEAVKMMMEVIMTEDEEIDETLGLKSGGGLTIPFKLAFNSKINKKLINKYLFKMVQVMIRLQNHGKKNHPYWWI